VPHTRTQRVHQTLFHERAETTILSPHAISLRSSLLRISEKAKNNKCIYLVRLLGQANNNKCSMRIEGTCLLHLSLCRLLAWKSSSSRLAAVWSRSYCPHSLSVPKRVLWAVDFPKLPVVD